MTKLLSPILAELQPGRVAFHCPGCDETHHIPVAPIHDPGTAWGWNGDAQKPTFTPSILVRSGHYLPGSRGGHCYCQPHPDGEEWGFECRQCHSFITDGQILFLGDCSHALAGQTVPLPPYPVAE